MVRRRYVWLGGGALVVLLVLVFFKPLLYQLFRITHPLFFESDLITRPDPRFGMDLLPDLHQARLVAPSRPHEQRRGLGSGSRDIKRRVTFFVDTNPHGFRGADIALERPAGGFRAACVGDSITFGWGVEESLSYPGQLRTLLETRLAGRPSEVINGGVPGCPLAFVADRIDAKLAPFRPDVVVAMKLGDLQAPNPLEAYGQQVRRIHATAQARGIRLIVALPPVSTFDVKPESRRFGTVLETVGRELSIPTVDFTPIFEAASRDRDGVRLVQTGGEQQVVRSRGGALEVLTRAPIPDGAPRVAPAIYDFLDTITDREPLFFDDGHPDAEGNGIIARKLLEVMEAQGWLEARPGLNPAVVPPAAPPQAPANGPAP